MHRRKKIAREDGTRWNYGYNPKGETTSGIREKTATNTPVPGWNHGYTFDEIGNRLTATTNGRISTYTPNALNQYESRTIPRAFDVIGKANAAASVTVNGNPTTRLDEFFYAELATGSGAVHTPYSVSATDSSGTTTRDGGKFLPATPEMFEHDDDGNLTSDGRFICAWDAENRLVSMETHPNVPLAARRKLVFGYDSLHRRIKKDVWHGTSTGGWQLHHKFDFIHELNGWNILAERSGGSADSFIRTYVWGTDLSGTLSGAGGVGGLLFATLHTSGKTFAYGMDLNSNVTLLVNMASGQTAATYDYGPFGELLRQSGEYAMLNPFRFSTKYTDDETGWMDYGFRYYDPITGRWRSRDPIGEQGGVNLYGFVENRPTNSVDYFGQWTLKEAEARLKMAGVAPAVPPQNHHNPYGGSSTPARYSYHQIFDKWIELEKNTGTGWYKKLPKCPADLCMVNGKPKNPDGTKWDDPGKVQGAEASLHLGAVWSMRSKPVDGHSNQCTYKEWGELERVPTASGTVDWAAPGAGFAHYDHDVAPVLLANKLDGGDGGNSMTMLFNQFAWPIFTINDPPGAYVKRYLEVRPLWAEEAGQ